MQTKGQVRHFFFASSFLKCLIHMYHTNTLVRMSVKKAVYHIEVLQIRKPLTLHNNLKAASTNSDNARNCIVTL